jgi:type II secretory pathway pseudopilin PulG
MKSIISIILIAASIAFFIFFTQPKWTELKANRLEVEKLNIAQDNAKKLKLKIDTLLNTKKDISEDDQNKIQKMIPDNVENVKLIIDFDKMLQDLVDKKGTANLYKSNDAENAGKISIENPKILQSSATIDGTFDTSQLGVADFSFSVSLTYNDFIDFLKRIETSTRIFDIESISFSTPNLTGSKNPNEVIYNFNVTLKTYWLKSK